MSVLDSTEGQGSRRGSKRPHLFHQASGLTKFLLWLGCIPGWINFSTLYVGSVHRSCSVPGSHTGPSSSVLVLVFVAVLGRSSPSSPGSATSPTSFPGRYDFLRSLRESRADTPMAFILPNSDCLTGGPDTCSSSFASSGGGGGRTSLLFLLLAGDAFFSPSSLPGDAPTVFSPWPPIPRARRRFRTSAGDGWNFCRPTGRLGLQARCVAFLFFQRGPQDLPRIWWKRYRNALAIPHRQGDPQHPGIPRHDDGAHRCRSAALSCSATAVRALC